MATLGERMLQQKRARENAAEEKKRLQELKKTADDLYIADKTLAFLNFIKNKTIQKVERNEEVEGIKIPDSLRIWTKNSAYVFFNDPRHPGFEYFDIFKLWLSQNDLDYIMVEEHDGSGVHSWHVFRIIPLERI